MYNLLSRFNIRQQVLFGYVPVLIILAFLAFSNFQSYKKFDQSFYNLREITKENINFLEIEKDIVELQRNILVYSYVGYDGVLKKIGFVQKRLEEKFIILTPIVHQDAEINDRFRRMLNHYNSYKEGFRQAVLQKNSLYDLNTNKMLPLVEEAQFKLDKIKEALITNNLYEQAYQISQIEKDFIQAKSNINMFRNSPDSFLVRDARESILRIQKKSVILKAGVQDESLINKIDDLLIVFEGFQENFKQIINVNRSYLHLINVVLSGRAAEIDKLSNELDGLVKQHSQALAVDIQGNVKQSQRQFIVLSMIAAFVGVVSSVFIAMGIANPVREMSSTLVKLSEGHSDIKIPGQERYDEVGFMADAANKFKVMAGNLENQTKELEEFAYRTSHDLRSPLMSALGLLNVAKKSIQNDQKETAFKTLDMAFSSLTKLDVLVQDILVLTKAKNEEEEVQSVDVYGVVNEAVKKLSHMEGFERLSFVYDLNYNEKLIVKKSRFVLIIENLVSNAVKYQDTTQDNSFIKLSTEKLEGDFCFSIEDNGLGIPLDQQKKLFTMFKRFHPRTSFGSGLGLYMIKKSASILDANIVFQDTGRGSLFTLQIPIHSHKL